ncbi:alpha/beta hydrolase fold protein [Solidesulfovibrio fructosivorans JJ]]|uniref:Alpha/beta hydrolase fold protein n=1 Tax=Solidesulfovibrio fructosivorans JJ] TaxID=596151 RepID=E1JX12_SOLFR|nr:alpha/beta hydrolase [Solidesulfovibrio fructosivorans]EFL51086.1 alpha/beta hydrolase fold protein [Solidesulfovibrio fructosivorans JJ]]
MPEFVVPGLEDLDACLQTPPHIARTAKGAVEYAERGRGAPLLCVHGGPGGYDQGMLLGELFRVNGFRVIGVSRPGYLGTPLATGATPEAQADALAALLDVLGLDRVAVLGASAGGPPAYMLAARHPDRVAALIQVDSVSRTYAIKASPLARKIFVTDMGLRLTAFFTDHFPKSALEGLLGEESTLDAATLKERVRHVLADPLKRELFVRMVHTFADRFPEREEGVRNDLAQYAAIGELPLAGISCPTLVMHGDVDNDVDPGDAVYAAGAIPGARLEWIRSGSHLAFWLADEAAAAQRTAVAWLKEQMERD